MRRDDGVEADHVHEREHMRGFALAQVICHGHSRPPRSSTPAAYRPRWHRPELAMASCSGVRVSAIWRTSRARRGIGRAERRRRRRAELVAGRRKNVLACPQSHQPGAYAEPQPGADRNRAGPRSEELVGLRARHNLVGDGPADGFPVGTSLCFSPGQAGETRNSSSRASGLPPGPGRDKRALSRRRPRSPRARTDDVADFALFGLEAALYCATLTKRSPGSQTVLLLGSPPPCPERLGSSKRRRCSPRT